MASESVVQNSRFALVEFLDSLPTLPMEGEPCSLLNAANVLLDIYKANLTNDRILIPLLEVLAYLFDMQVLGRLVDTDFRYVEFSSRPLCDQRNHYL
jgi:tubulin-specific chaperone D